MLSYLYPFTSIDYRWLLLGLTVSLLSRYTAVASILDWFHSSRYFQPFLTKNGQSYLLYFMCQGTVALSLIIRTGGELLDTSNVGIMLRVVLFMIHFSVLSIIIIANPLMERRKTNFIRTESNLHFSDSLDYFEAVSQGNDDDDIVFESFKRDTIRNHSTDCIFPYLVKIDTTHL